MRILFMGTPDFASHNLEKLIENNENIVGVFTRADTPKGRGMKMQFSPVKEVALKHDIPVFQPTKLRNGEALETIKSLKPDIIIVVAYGRILPSEILDYPKFGCVNVHASLLPKYRGAGPIQWAVLNGDKTTGVTTMYMSEGLDEGDMILKSETDILKHETSGELFERLRELGAKTLIDTIDLIKSGTAPREPQDSNLATFAPMLTKEMGNLDFSLKASQVICKIYGFNPWPSAYSFIDGKKFKIFEAYEVECDEKYDSGTIFKVSNEILVSCGENTAIAITSIQADGKKRMQTCEYLKGNKIELGSKFERI